MVARRLLAGLSEPSAALGTIRGLYVAMHLHDDPPQMRSPRPVPLPRAFVVMNEVNK